MMIVDWLLLAARNVGLAARAVPLPAGPDQPHGMYVEIASDDVDQRALAGVAWGAVDLVVAGEHGQLARVIAAGYSSAECTTIVSSCARAYSDAERSSMLHGVLREQAIDEAARHASVRYTAFDTSEIVGWYALPATAQTALLFGAVFGSGVLGVERDACLLAIAQLGIDAGMSTRAFRRGERFGRRSGARVRRRLTAAQFVRKRRGTLPWSEREAFEALVSTVDTAFDETQRDAIRAGVYELTDFHDAAYAERYIEQCALVHRAEQAAGLDARSIVPEVARHLAAMMAYPDLARIAQLKLRSQRLRSIAKQHGIGRSERWELTDYIPVDVSELAHLARSASVREMATPGVVGAEQLRAVRTTTVRGALQLRQWRRLRSRRASSARHRAELETAECYVAAVLDALEIEPRIAAMVARSGGIVRGSGVARAANRVTAMTFWGHVVRQSLALDRTRPPGVEESIAAILVPHLHDQLTSQGVTALWDAAHHVVGIAMHQARGGTWHEAYAFARQLCGLEPLALPGAHAAAQPAAPEDAAPADEPAAAVS
jgi:hypothetical protein